MKLNQPSPRILNLADIEPHLEKLISLETLESQEKAFIGKGYNFLLATKLYKVPVKQYQ